MPDMSANRDNDNPGKGPTGTGVGSRFQGQVAIVTGPWASQLVPELKGGTA
jgi:hypothetical protein